MSKIILGSNPNKVPVCFELKLTNRHGLVAGATGTGKTVTLQRLAEQFSKNGVSVFTADVKGDLTGLIQQGSESPKITERLSLIGQPDYKNQSYPVEFWDLTGKSGIPLRITIKQLGPILLAKLLDLNDIQTGVLQIAFKLCDDQGAELVTLQDLRVTLNHIDKTSSALQLKYGNISSSSIGAILRALLSLEEAGAQKFFGKPEFNILDFIKTDSNGRGNINLLNATQLIQNNRVYAVFLMWLLTQLFEVLEEVGDSDKPKLVFFFDEAHLLFKDLSKHLLEKIETTVRLVRSKGVGIYFVTQSPGDIPDSVLAQLGHRVQHALRSFSENDQKIIKNAAKSFRTKPDQSLEKEISELGIGEAFVSYLNLDGTPSYVERVWIAPPESKIGPADSNVVSNKIEHSAFKEKYLHPVQNKNLDNILKLATPEKLKQNQL